MKRNSSSSRQIFGLFVIIGFIVGVFLAWPLAEFVFNSPKGMVFLGRWVVPVFALACGLAGGAIPYWFIPTPSLDRKSWILIVFLTLLEMFVFLAASTIGAGICRMIHRKTLDLPNWVANTIFLMIPITTMLVVISVGMYMNRKRFFVSSK
jgi:hypothetical protein